MSRESVPFGRYNKQSRYYVEEGRNGPVKVVKKKDPSLVKKNRDILDATKGKQPWMVELRKDGLLLED